MKNKKLIAGILTCSIIGGSAASLSCFAENSPEAIIASATSQAVNPSLTVVEESKKPKELSESEKKDRNIESAREEKETPLSATTSPAQASSRSTVLEKLMELKKSCEARLNDDIFESEKRALKRKIRNIDHNIERAQAGKEVPSEAFELPAILTKSTSKPLEEKSPKFNWKKIAIGAGVIALTVGSGYAAYKFIPAVQDAINNNVLPLAQSGLEKAGNYTSSALSTTKNFAGDLYSNLSKSGKNVLSLAQTGLDAAEIYTSSALSTTKNFAGSSCSKLYDYLSNTFHSSGNKPNLNLPSDSAKAVQTTTGGNTLPSAQGWLDKVGNSTSSTFRTAKNVQAATCSNTLPSAQGWLDKVVNSTNSTFSTVKSYVGSSCNKIHDYLSNAFHFDNKSLKNKLVASGTLIACDSATILTCLLLTRFK